MLLRVPFFAMILLALSSALRNNQSLFRSRSRSALRLSTSSSSNKLKFVLEYAYVADILEKRGPYRPQHLKLAEDHLKDGSIIYGGPFTPPTGAMFIFSVDGRESVEAFIAEDPYVTNGLVTTYTIKEWNVLIGSIWANLTINELENASIHVTSISSIPSYGSKSDVPCRLFKRWSFFLRFEYWSLLPAVELASRSPLLNNFGFKWNSGTNNLSTENWSIIHKRCCITPTTYV